MPFFSSLPEDAGVRHILAMNPRAGRALQAAGYLPLLGALAAPSATPPAPAAAD